MIVVERPHKYGADPVLVYDADEEELWGYEKYWEGHKDLVGLSGDEFRTFFNGHRWIVGETDVDPFKDVPNAEDLCRNYPPGSEEIPDLPTPEPAASYEPDADEEAAEKIADAALDAIEEDDSGN